MARVSNFTDCCSGAIFSGFGGGHVGETESWSKRELIKWLCDKLTKCKLRYATVVAIPTSSQPNAIAALEEVGFYQHPDGVDGGGYRLTKSHKMCVMFMPLYEWDEKKFLESYDPNKDDYKDKPNRGEKFTKTTADTYW
jgi:hypothetical protein